MKNGELNLHSNIGGSITGAIANMKTIWEYALTKLLKIDSK